MSGFGIVTSRRLFLQRNSARQAVKTAQPKRNFAMPGYDTQFPDGGGPVEKWTTRGIIFVASACFLLDGDMIKHEWHKYKTGGDLFSDVPNWYSPSGGYEQGPKREGLKSRYE